MNPDYRPYGTWTLLLACIVIFVRFGLARATDDYGTNYLDAGAATPALVATGQWWRLLTSNFVHFGFLHILMNGIGIYYLGPRLEFELGLKRYLILFIVTGTVGGAYANLLCDPYIPSAGASGGLFGMLGAYMALGIRSGQGLMEYFQTPAGRSMGSILLINLVFGLVVPQISLAAHIGGFVAGLLLCLYAYRLGRLPIRPAAAIATWLGFVFCIVFVVQPVHRTWYLGRSYWLAEGPREKALVESLVLRIPATERGPLILLEEFRKNQRDGRITIRIPGSASVVAGYLWRYWGIPLETAQEMADARAAGEAGRIPEDPWKP